MGTAAFDLSTLKPASQPPAGGVSAFDMSTLRPAAPAAAVPAPATQPGAAPKAPVPPQATGSSISETMAVANPKGLVEPGNLSIWNRPSVQNADGTHSSEYSVSFADEKGRETLVPTVVNGKFLTPDGKKPPEGSTQEKAMFKAAWQHYLKTGEHLGKFDNPDNADAYAGILHGRGERPVGQPDNNPRLSAKDTISAYTPGPIDILRESIANSAVGHGLASTMPNVAHALHLEPTETEAEQQRTNHAAQLVNPAPFIEDMTQPLAEGISTAARAGGIPLPAPPPGMFRQDATQPKTTPQNIQTGMAEAAGSMTDAPSLAMMAIPIGEIAGLTGKLGAQVIPRLVSAGFSAQMIKGLYDQSREYKQARDSGDNERAEKIMGQMVATAPMLFAAAFHAAHGGQPGIPEPKIDPDAVERYRQEQAAIRAGDQIHAPVPKTVEPNVPRETAEEKPILHTTDDVEKLRASAERQAPAIGDAAAKAAEGVDGAKVEAVRDSKDTDRIEDKSERQGVSPSQIADIAAAKITVPDQAAAEQVLENLHREMPVESVTGAVTGEPGKNSVRQVQAVVNTGAEGEPLKRAEVLIQTPEMAAATDETHDDYRKAQELRQAGKTAEADALEKQIAERHEAAEKEAQDRNQPENQNRAVLADSPEQTMLGNPKPEDTTERIPTSQITLDPQRFQYKLDTDKSGVTNLLKGRKWNEDLSGRIQVWRAPDDGKLYVVNGHHRFQLAQDNKVPDVKVDYIKAPTAEEARAVGALQNIADGRGTAVDAAKFFRDSKYTPERLDELGISMGEATAANGVALSRLDPSLFDQVVSGKLRQGRGIAIGNASADPADQEALVKLIQKAESKGRKVTDDVVDELARMVKGAGQHTETQQNLFGAQEMTRSLAIEKAEISSAIRDRIGQERRTFQSVADTGKATQLGKVEGQTLRPEENAAIAKKAEQALELYDRLSTRGGTIDDILNRSAKELADGGNANGIKQRAYDDVRKSIQDSLPGTTGQDDRGVQAPQKAQPARPASAAPIPPERTAGQPGAGRSAPAAGPADLRAPVPPEGRPAKFQEGRQTTPIQVKDAAGKWVNGTLDFFNGGRQPQQPRRGRVTLATGEKMNNVPEESMRTARPDVGIDFDGTLALDTGSGKLGEPIPKRIASVKQMLAEGKSVEIITRRVEQDPTGEKAKQIQDWLEANGLPRLPVSDVKNAGVLYDDNAHHAPSNANTPLVEEPRARDTAPGADNAQYANDGKAPRPPKVAAAGDAGTRPTGLAQVPGEAYQSGIPDHIRAPKPVDRPEQTDDRGRATVPVARAGDNLRRSGEVVPDVTAEAGRTPEQPTPADDLRRQPGHGEDLAREQRENQDRAQERKIRIDAAATRTLPENAAAHKSQVIDLDNGRKGLLLDPDGEAVWHRLFRKVKAINGQNILGAGENWRGVNIDKTGVNIAIAYLKAGAEDNNASGIPAAGAGEGYDRMVDLLKKARNEDGSVSVMRGDYRADTAREEATHQWQREHALEKSDAMAEVASRPEFTHAAEKLRTMGYGDVTPKTLAAEMMAKALAGDLDFPLTDAQREELVRGFLTEAVEEKGPEILKNIPATDPRVKSIVDEVKRGYDYGEQYDQRTEERSGEAPRSGNGQGGSRSGEAVAGPRDGNKGSRGQRADEGSGRGVQEERPSKAELEEAGQRAFFQGKQSETGEKRSNALRNSLVASNAYGQSFASIYGDDDWAEMSPDQRAAAIDQDYDEVESEIEKTAAKQARDEEYDRQLDKKIAFMDRHQLQVEKLLDKAGIEYHSHGTSTYSRYINADLPDDKTLAIRVSDHAPPVGRGGMKEGGLDYHDAADISIHPGSESLYEIEQILREAKPGAPLFQGKAPRPPASMALPGFERDIEANKIGKPFEAKVGETKIQLPDESDQRIALAADTRDQARVRLQNLHDAVAGGQVPYPDEQTATDNARVELHDAEQQLAAEIARSSDLEGKELTVPYLPITDSMRATATEEGFPLFQKAKDSESPVARTVADLVEEMKNAPRPPKGTMLDRVASSTADTVDQSLGRSKGAFEKIPGTFEKAFAWSKATTAALVHDYLHPLEQTDWKTQVGQMQLAEAETDIRLQGLAKELIKAAPKELDRIAMTHWMEAAGNEARLKEWRAGSKALAMQAMNDPLMDSGRRRYLRDAQEHYEKALNLTPDQKALAQRLRQHFDDMLDLAKQNGLIEYGYRNYVMHLYEKADAANLLHMVDASELNPDPAFIKKRFYDTFYTAEQNGLKPKTKDIGHLLTAYDQSMNTAIASRNFMRSLLDAKAPDGRPIAAIKMRGGWLIAKEGQQPQVLKQRARPASLEGYRDFDRPQLRNFLFKPTTEDLAGYDPKLFDEDPEKLAFRGDLIIHPKYASQVEDMLTPSWFDRNEGKAQKVGHAIQTASAAAKEFMTVLAPFHMVQEGIHSTEHMVNPFKVHPVDLSGSNERSQRLRMGVAHGLTLTNYNAEGLFGTKALRGIAEFMPGVNRAMDGVHSFAHWQFNDYIPGLKADMYDHAFQRNLKRYPKLEPEQVAELTAKQANAAFGNLNTAFDAVPRTKTFKSLLRLAAFAPDFFEARMRFVGQAMGRYGGEQRAALARGALVMYATARIANALLNQGDAKWDPEHAFSIVVNGKAYSLRTVQGDILHAVTDPRGFAYNRMNPLTTRPIVQFLSGRDQVGRPKTAASTAVDTAKSVLPFGIQKVIQTSDEDWLNSILTSTGFEARNDRTPTEEAVHKAYLAGIPDAQNDEEKQAESRKLRGIEDKVRAGKMQPKEVWDLVDKGEVTAREAGRTIERAQQSRLALEFKSLRLKDAMKIYGEVQAKARHSTMFPHEALDLAELKPEMERKRALVEELPEADRAAAQARLDDMLAENEPQ